VSVDFDRKFRNLKMRRNFWMKVDDKVDESRLKRMKNVDDS